MVSACEHYDRDRSFHIFVDTTLQVEVAPAADCSRRQSRGNVSVAARVWALAWRKRWGARLGTLRQTEELSEESARWKVRDARFVVVVLGQLSVPLYGTW